MSPKSLKDCKSSAEERAYLSDGRLSEQDWSEMLDVEVATATGGGEVVSLRFDADVTRQLHDLARRKRVPYTTLIRAWVLERLDAEQKPQLKVRSGGKK